MTEQRLFSEQNIRAMTAELKRGNDIRIQKTPNGYRIIADKVTVIGKIAEDNNEK